MGRSKFSAQSSGGVSGRIGAISPLMHLRDGLYARYFRLIHGRRFARFGRGSRILFPRDVYNPDRIAIGDDVEIFHFSLLAAAGLIGEAPASLTIGSGCRLGTNNHIFATRRIVLGSAVLTAGNVYISDNSHGYEAVGTPVSAQPVRQLSEVTIGDGAWLGANVCVVGANVGRGAVVGANSVVVHDIPDYAVAVGVPARIVKRYDPATGLWHRGDEVGATASVGGSPADS